MERYNNKRNVIFNPDKVQKWNIKKNTIVSIDNKYVDKLSKPFDYLRKNASDGYSDYQELLEASSIVKKNELAKVKKLELEKKAGYITISTLTIIVTLVVGMIIFTTIGMILGG